MLWVLKRTVSMKRFSKHPKHMFKLISNNGKKIQFNAYCFYNLLTTMQLPAKQKHSS